MSLDAPPPPVRGLSGGALDRLAALWAAALRRAEMLRGVIFIGAVVCAAGALLVLTPQGRDLALAITESGRGLAFGAAVTGLSSLLFGAQAWFWARRIVDENAGGYAEWSQDPVLTWTPRLLGAAPAVFAGTALAGCGAQVWAAAAVLLALGAAVFALLTIRRRLLASLDGRAARRGKAPRFTEDRLRRTADRFRLFSFALSAVGMASACLSPVAGAQAVGSVGVVYLGCALIIPPVAALVHRSRALRLPVLEGLIVWAVVLSAFGDNHAIGRRALGGLRPDLDGAPSPPTLAQAFDAWYAQAPGPADRGPKPMVVVAVEGGASRAGYWSAELLGRLQEGASARPFSDSVFALSSVSGGSVGAAAFVSQLHDRPRPERGFHDAITDVAGGDFLSPVLAGLLFPDLLQRFLPLVPLGDGRVLALPDRAEALEKAFEAGWRGHCRRAGCRDPDLWRRGLLTLAPDLAPSAPWTPLLLVNGAREEDGRRVLTATVAVSPDDFPDALDYHVAAGRDLAISTAIHNGARFPLISPGGTLLDRAGRAQGHILDGGYFEGSGVSTAMDVVHTVQRLAAAGPGRAARPVRPIVLEINNDDDLPRDSPALSRVPSAVSPAALAALQPPVKTSYLLADLLGPLNGVAQSRDGHGRAAAVAAAYGVARGEGGLAVGSTFRLLHLCRTASGGMPMDWALSPHAREVAETAAKTDVCGIASQIRDINLNLAAASASIKH